MRRARKKHGIWEVWGALRSGVVLLKGGLPEGKGWPRREKRLSEGSKKRRGEGNIYRRKVKARGEHQQTDEKGTHWSRPS